MDCATAAPAPAPLHFIFHSAYCCSTLMARVFDLPGISTSLKEPQILNDMVGWRHRGAEAQRLGLVLSSSLDMLARPFEPGEAVVIKPSNLVNGLAEPMLRMRPQANALLLYAPLKAFLASIARKGMWGRLWVRELLLKQLADGLIDLGFEPQDYLTQTDLQVAAVGWLAQHALFRRLAEQYPGRVRTLDSELLVARPAEAVAATADLFGLPLTGERLAQAVAAEFSRDAKDGSAFTPERRARSFEAGLDLHREKIEKVTLWAEAVAANAGVALEARNPLLG